MGNAARHNNVQHAILKRGTSAMASKARPRTTRQGESLRCGPHPTVPRDGRGRKRLDCAQPAHGRDCRPPWMGEAPRTHPRPRRRGRASPRCQGGARWCGQAPCPTSVCAPGGRRGGPSQGGGQHGGARQSPQGAPRPSRPAGVRGHPAGEEGAPPRPRLPRARAARQHSPHLERARRREGRRPRR